jgi:hypothetical protein
VVVGPGSIAPIRQWIDPVSQAKPTIKAITELKSFACRSRIATKRQDEVSNLNRNWKVSIKQ